MEPSKTRRPPGGGRGARCLRRSSKAYRSRRSLLPAVKSGAQDELTVDPVPSRLLRLEHDELPIRTWRLRSLHCDLPPDDGRRLQRRLANKPGEREAEASRSAGDPLALLVRKPNRDNRP